MVPGSFSFGYCTQLKSWVRYPKRSPGKSGGLVGMYYLGQEVALTFKTDQILLLMIFLLQYLGKINSSCALVFVIKIITVFCKVSVSNIFLNILQLFWWIHIIKVEINSTNEVMTTNPLCAEVEPLAGSITSNGVAGKYRK